MKGIVRNADGLFVHTTYEKATPNERDRVCNGCGSADAKFDFVPDTIYGLNINAACNPHDWAYSKGKTWQDKFIADICFLANLLVIITRHGGWLRWLRYKRALKYWMAVHEKGASAFFMGKTIPKDTRKERRASKE